MTISIYSGLPGSGKSYTVVTSVILPALQQKRVIWTNIPLDLEAIEAEHGIRPTQFDIKEIQTNDNWFRDVLPCGALVIIDECWRLWPSGLKANNAIESHKEFLAEHRHLVGADGRSTEVVLVSQDAAQLAAFVRQLIEKTYRAKKLDVVGQAKRYRLDIWEGCVTGANPPLDKRVREIYGEYKPEIYRLYKSHTKSETGAAGNEEKADQRANVLKGGRIKAILLALVILPLFVAWGGYSTYQKFSHPKGLKITPVEPAPVGNVSAKPRKRPEDGFLWDRNVVIVFNNSNGVTVDYIFRVSDDRGFVTLDAKQLYRLGYTVWAIDPCLARIEGHGGQQFVLCRNDQNSDVVGRTLDNLSGQNVM